MLSLRRFRIPLCMKRNPMHCDRVLQRLDRQIGDIISDGDKSRSAILAQKIKRTNRPIAGTNSLFLMKMNTYLNYKWYTRYQHMNDCTVN